MTNQDQYAKVKYALYNSRSIQADSDDELGSDKKITYKFMHPKTKNDQDTKIFFSSSSIQKSHSVESHSEPVRSLHQVSKNQVLVFL